MSTWEIDRHTFAYLYTDMRGRPHDRLLCREWGPKVINTIVMIQAGSVMSVPWLGDLPVFVWNSVVQVCPTAWRLSRSAHVWHDRCSPYVRRCFTHRSEKYRLPLGQVVWYDHPCCANSIRHNNEPLLDNIKTIVSKIKQTYPCNCAKKFATIIYRMQCNIPRSIYKNTWLNLILADVLEWAVKIMEHKWSNMQIFAGTNVISSLHTTNCCQT